MSVSVPAKWYVDQLGMEEFAKNRKNVARLKIENKVLRNKVISYNVKVISYNVITLFRSLFLYFVITLFRITLKLFISKNV